jgi:hypothetical protein
MSDFYVNTSGAGDYADVSGTVVTWAVGSDANTLPGVGSPKLTLNSALPNAAGAGNTITTEGDYSTAAAVTASAYTYDSFKPNAWRGSVITNTSATATITFRPEVAASASLPIGQVIGSFVVESGDVVSKVKIVEIVNKGADNTLSLVGLKTVSNYSTPDSGAAATSHILDGWVRGTMNYYNCEMSGWLENYGIFGNNIVAVGTTKNVNINGVDFDLTVKLSGAGTSAAVRLLKSSTSAGTYNVVINAVKGTIRAASGQGDVVHGIEVLGVNSCNIAGSDIVMDVAGTNTARGIYVYGSSSHTLNGAIISGNKITAKNKRGFGIAVGDSYGANTYLTNTVVRGNQVIAKKVNADGTETPHNYCLGGQQSTGTLSSANISEHGYIGYLFSTNSTGTSDGDLALNAAGSGFYIKGSGAWTIKNGYAMVNSQCTQMTDTASKNAPICVTYQSDNTNTASDSLTISDMVVMVSDMDKVGCLSALDPRFGDTGNPQYCTISNITYIIPDTVDATGDLFGYLQHTTPNYTLADWNAINVGVTPNRTIVSGCKIVQLPASEIEAMIAATFARASGNGSGSSSGLIGGLISGLIN